MRSVNGDLAEQVCGRSLRRVRRDERGLDAVGGRDGRGSSAGTEESRSMARRRRLRAGGISAGVHAECHVCVFVCVYVCVCMCVSCRLVEEIYVQACIPMVFF